MNTALPLSGLLVAALALASCGAHAAVKPEAPAPEAPPPKSVFVIDPQTSKDPFNPRSVRWKGNVVKTNETVAIPSSQFPPGVRVQGFSNQRGAIIVILNGKSVAKGEKVDINLGGQRVPIRFVDVTEKTILLEANGITQEFPLPGAAPTPATPQPQ